MLTEHKLELRLLIIYRLHIPFSEIFIFRENKYLIYVHWFTDLYEYRAYFEGERMGTPFLQSKWNFTKGPSLLLKIF